MTLPPMSATNAPTAATMPGRSGHLRRRAARTAAGSEELQRGVDVASQPGQVDLHAGDALARRVHARLGLDLLRDEHAGGRRVLRVAVEARLVAEQLVHARDLTDALHLDDHRLPVAVAAEQVDRADVGGELSPYEDEVVAERGDACGEELLELRLDTVLLQA